MSKHSKGPWYLHLGWQPRSCIVTEECGRPVALAECFAMRTEGEREANIALISAAPELLEMLREYGSKCEECGGSAEIITNNRDGDPEYDRAKPCVHCQHIWALVDKATGAHS